MFSLTKLFTVALAATSVAFAATNQEALMNDLSKDIKAATTAFNALNASGSPMDATNVDLYRVGKGPLTVSAIISAESCGAGKG